MGLLDIFFEIVITLFGVTTKIVFHIGHSDFNHRYLIVIITIILIIVILLSV